MAREIIFPSNPHAEGTPVPVVVLASQPDGGVQLASIKDWEGKTLQDQGGYYVELDRRQINKLIKALRAARDRAYGVDE